MFKTNFSGHNKIWGGQKDLVVTASECSTVSAGLGRTVARKSSIGGLLRRGGRHSENLFVIHKMNSICRLCKLIITIFSQIPIVAS